MCRGGSDGGEHAVLPLFLMLISVAGGGGGIITKGGEGEGEHMLDSERGQSCELRSVQGAVRSVFGVYSSTCTPTRQS